MSGNYASRIVIENYGAMLQIVVSLTDNSRGIIHDCNIIIVQAAVFKLKHSVLFWLNINDREIHLNIDMCGLYYKAMYGSN